MLTFYLTNLKLANQHLEINLSMEPLVYMVMIEDNFVPKIIFYNCIYIVLI